MALATDAPKQPEFVLSEQLEIFTSCKNLPKLNSYVIIKQMDEEKDEFVTLNNTEVVTDNYNPEFTKPIVIDYKFEEVQLIRLEVYESDTILNKVHYIGNCEFVLADLAAADGAKITMKLTDKAGKSIIVEEATCFCTVQSEEVIKNTDELLIQFSANNLPKMTWFSGTNPYLQVYRKAAASDTVNDGWMSVFRTSSLHKTCDPQWASTTIPIQRLCNGDNNREILIKCFQDNDAASPEQIGYCKTTLTQLLDTFSQILTHPKDLNKDCGKLLFNCQLNQNHTFLQYIRGGMEIQMIIAIDFTASNGDPKTEKSLHYIGGGNTFDCESPYMSAIKSVGRVLEPYDADGMIECYGFGANINPFGAKKISHCFNLTLTDENEVKGINGVLETYKKSLAKIQLYGPTYFNEIISIAAKSAAEMVNNEKEQNYIILLIIADGVVNDMQKTIDRIVEATELPLSVVIVGVGDADFSAMIRLDANDEPLKSSKGVVMKRDIVQFVEFNKFKNKGLSDLAKEVLEEIPDQVIEYMKIKNLSPLRKNNITPIGEENKRKYTPGGNDDCKNDETYFEPPNKKQKLIYNNSNNSVL